MKKVIRRTQMAIAQAERRKQRRRAINVKDEWHMKRQSTELALKERHTLMKTAHLQRKEDWELGPLAPRRDVGNAKDTYGTVPSTQVDLRPSSEEREKGIALFGGKYCSIRSGDRVVVLAGRDKGKIGKVLDVMPEEGGVKIQGVNMIEVEMADWMQTNIPEDQRRPTVPTATLTPFTDVRLVTALYNPEKQETRDVIVKEIATRNIKRDVLTNEVTWDRNIAGTSIVIPWPKVDEPEKVDHPIDTLRIKVEEKTWVPTLLTVPMPSAVIDELRNKFSKFRTRHTQEYIASKEAEEAEVRERIKSIKKMRTPLQEKNRKDRKERKKKGKGVLTEEMLAALGQVIAKNKGLTVKETAEKTLTKNAKSPPPPEEELVAEPVVAEPVV